MAPQLDADWVTDPFSQTVLKMLEADGHQAFFVGGCVRNALLKTAASDIDIATSARPDQVTELAKAAKIKPVPTGIEHGTVTLVSNAQTIEVTTFRKDVATDGRRATVAFADRIEEDALRRDFTINALYADRHGRVTDVVDGLTDIQTRTIRFIEDPAQRIQEDYLRILRFFRFYAWYGDPLNGIDEDGLAACAEHADGLDTLSKERVGAEVSKLLSAPDPGASVSAMHITGVLSRVLPGAEPRFLGPLIANEITAAQPVDWRRRLAVLGQHDWSAALRLKKKDQRHIKALHSALANDTSLSELAYREGAELAWSAGLIRSASLETQIAPDTGSAIEAAQNAVFPLTATDLQPQFQGKALGQKLKEAETAWIASGFVLTKNELLK